MKSQPAREVSFSSCCNAIQDLVCVIKDFCNAVVLMVKSSWLYSKTMLRPFPGPLAVFMDLLRACCAQAICNIFKGSYRYLLAVLLNAISLDL